MRPEIFKTMLEIAEGVTTPLHAEFFSKMTYLYLHQEVKVKFR